MAELITVDLGRHEPDSNERTFQAHRPPSGHWSGRVAIEASLDADDEPITTIKFDGDDSLGSMRIEEGGLPEDLAKDGWVAGAVRKAIEGRVSGA